VRCCPGGPVARTKRGVRTQIRAAVPCPACGAAVGAPCTNYTGRNTRTGAETVIGTPSPDVHAARWYDWVNGLARARHAAQLRLGGAVADGPARQRARLVARLKLGRELPGLRPAVRGRGAHQVVRGRDGLAGRVLRRRSVTGPVARRGRGLVWAGRADPRNRYRSSARTQRLRALPDRSTREVRPPCADRRLTMTTIADQSSFVVYSPGISR
jgi:hypothetical protein